MCESLWKKMIGKPDSGKLNVRFDEGELEIGLCHYASSLLYHLLSSPATNPQMGQALGMGGRPSIIQFPHGLKKENWEKEIME